MRSTTSWCGARRPNRKRSEDRIWGVPPSRRGRHVVLSPPGRGRGVFPVARPTAAGRSRRRRRTTRGPDGSRPAKAGKRPGGFRRRPRRAIGGAGDSVRRPGPAFCAYAPATILPLARHCCESQARICPLRPPQAFPHLSAVFIYPPEARPSRSSATATTPKDQTQCAPFSAAYSRPTWRSTSGPQTRWSM